jgi:hypothetical protein
VQERSSKTEAVRHDLAPERREAAGAHNIRTVDSKVPESVRRRSPVTITMIYDLEDARTVSDGARNIPPRPKARPSSYRILPPVRAPSELFVAERSLVLTIGTGRGTRAEQYAGFAPFSLQHVATRLPSAVLGLYRVRRRTVSSESDRQREMWRRFEAGRRTVTVATPACVARGCYH